MRTAELDLHRSLTCLSIILCEFRVQVGNQPLSLSEQRAQFALWAILKSPLLIGTNLHNASQQVQWSP